MLRQNLRCAANPLYVFMYLKHPSQIQSILVGIASFLLRTWPREADAGELREDEVFGSDPLVASALMAGASRAEVDKAPPRLLALSLRAAARFVAAGEPAPSREVDGD